MKQSSTQEHFSVACLGITMAQKISATWGGSSVLMVGAGVGTGVGGINQSFLFSNKFFEADHVLSQGVLYLGGASGISSSGGELEFLFWGLVVGHGTSANCPIANLYTVICTDYAVDLTDGVWVLTVATMGADVVAFGMEGVGWVSTIFLR